MIEMRWLVRREGGTAEKVLQMRQQHKTTIYAQTLNMIAWPNHNNGTSTLEWSEWYDVPTVDEYQ